MNRDKIKNVSSDFELLSLLEAAVEEKEAAAAQEPVEEEQPAPEGVEPVDTGVINAEVTPDGVVQATTATGVSLAVDNTKTLQIQVTENYSDAFLLSLLEENGLDISYSNLKILKEGLKSGTITLEEDSSEDDPDISLMEWIEENNIHIDSDEDLLLEFSLFKKLTPEEKAAKKAAKEEKKAKKAAAKAEKEAAKLEKCRAHYLKLDKYRLAESIAGDVAWREAPTGEGVQYKSSHTPRYAAILRNSSEYSTLIDGFYDVVKNAETRKEIYKAYSGLVDKSKRIIEDYKYLREAANEAPVEEECPEGECPEECAPVEEPCEGEECGAPRVQITMPVDGSMVIDNQGKQVQADPQGNITVALAEAKAIRTTDKFLRSYLVED